MTVYKRLDWLSAVELLNRAGINWTEVGISPVDGVAYAVVPEFNRSRKGIYNQAAYIKRQLERVGAVMTLFSVIEQKVYFRVPEMEMVE